MSPSIGHNRIKTLRGQQWFWLRARAVEGSHSSDSPGLSNRHSASRVMEGTQAEQTSLRPRDSPDHSSRWVCGLGLPGPHLQALLNSQHSRRLPRAICLHYAGLFGEVSDGRLSWLREGLIYRQMCFEGLLKVALLQIRARRWQPQASPGPWGIISPLGGLGVS